MKKKIISLAMLGMLFSLLLAPTFVLAYENVDLTRGKIQFVIADIGTWITTIAGIAGIIVILYAAILYMVAGGDEEKTATAKKALIGGVIGIALAVIAFGIFGLVASFLK